MSQLGYDRNRYVTTTTTHDSRPWSSTGYSEQSNIWCDLHESKPKTRSGTTRGTMDPDATWLNPTDWNRVLNRVLSHSRSTVREDLRIVDNSWITRSWDVGDGFNMTDFPYPPNKQSTYQNLYDRLVTEALMNLRQGRLSLGADLGEARGTMDMIAGAGTTLLKGASAARRGNFGAIPGILGMSRRDVLSGRYPANKWLEYQYGWKPLMGSIYDGMDRLKNGFRKKRYSNRFYARSRGQDQVTHHGTREAKFTGWRHNLNHRYSVAGHCKLWYEVENASVDKLDAAGLLNPLSVAWELVPFSFVFDWFAPVGNTLTALTATSGLRFVSGYISMKGLTSLDVDTFQRDDADPAFYQTISLGSATMESMEFQRGVFNDFPSPRFYANTHPLSTPRIANALALLRQMF